MSATPAARCLMNAPAFFDLADPTLQARNPVTDGS